MKVFIIGVAGGVGGHMAEELLASGDEPTGLVRKSEQEQLLRSKGMKVTTGDPGTMQVSELAAAMRGCQAVVFSAGAGGKESTAALLHAPQISRMILEVTGGHGAIAEAVATGATPC